MLYVDGKLIATDNQMVKISEEDYNKLPDSKKNNGDVYFVDSGNDSASNAKLIHLMSSIGNTSKLTNVSSDGTIVGAILSLYERLGGMSFSIDEEGEALKATYSDEVTPVEIPDIPVYLSDEEKIKYYMNILGDINKIGEKGFTNLSDMLLNIYNRLNGLSFVFDSETGNVDISYDDGK